MEPVQPVEVTQVPPSPGPEQGQEEVPGVNRSRFRVGDVVTISFSGTTELLPPHEERVKEDGTITLPYVGPVQASGKSPGELQRYLHEAYKKYYKNLVVTVKSFQRYFYVGGEVRQPGPQLYLGETTVLKAVQTAGDFTDFARKSKVQIVRTDGTVLTMDCGDAIKDPSLDISIYPGDRINVPRRVF
jgi:polysaccharide export outer membrane protein